MEGSDTERVPPPRPSRYILVTPDAPGPWGACSGNRRAGCRHLAGLAPHPWAALWQPHGHGAGGGAFGHSPGGGWVGPFPRSGAADGGLDPTPASAAGLV